jgi:hypothetical protein
MYDRLAAKVYWVKLDLYHLIEICAANGLETFRAESDEIRLNAI